MKKILRIFAFCVAFMSSGELVHAQVFVKTDAVKSIWSDYDFNEQGTTLESVIVFCMNKSGATISGCREKVKQIVAKHNQTLKESKPVQVQPAETPEIVNDVEQNKSTETKEHSYQCTGVSRTLSSAAEAQTPAELDCVSKLKAAKVCRQGDYNMLGINKVCDTNTRKCVYACMLNKMDFYNRKYKTICCNVSSASDDVNCAWGRKEGNYTDVEGPGAGELSVHGC